MVVLTGSIATGKSSACGVLRKFGYEIIDADKIAKAVISSKKIEELFGSVYIQNGEVDRKALGRLVFSDPLKREMLNNYIHPLIKNEIYKKVSEFEKKKIKYIVDIPLFFESKRYEAEIVALVYCSKDEQIKRLMHRDDLSRDEALGRINAQIDIEEKRKKADFIIDNQKDKKYLENEVKKFIGKIGANFKI